MTLQQRAEIATGPLIGEERRRLPSQLITDYEPVFRGAWHSAQPRSRFGDEEWELAGVDPGNSRTTWVVSFADMTPEWSLIARETLFLHINQAEFRHIVGTTPSAKPHKERLRASSLDIYHASFRRLADLADQLQLGLPNRWLTHHVDALQEAVQAEGITGVGRIVKLLVLKNEALTLGGLRWDPFRGMSMATWEGSTASSRVLSNRGVSPEVFRTIVGNALFYVEHASNDILAARDFINSAVLTGPSRAVARRSGRDAYRERYPDHEDVRDEWTSRAQDAISRIGGVPVATVSMSGAKQGEPCIRTLRYAAGLKKPSRSTAALAALLDARLAAGVPPVPGGLPVAITNVERPDGTIGPWRDPFCFKSVAVEVNTLIAACKIVVMAFTAMRDSELARIPRHGWRTTWSGAPAIVAPEIKTRAGEELKWWATPPVLQACEVLALLVDDDHPYLFQDAKRQGDTLVAHGENWTAIQHFVRRMNTDPHLKGVHSIPAGWGTVAAKKGSNSHPTIHPRAFRFTLSSISNFVALGDVAFQQQAKHAHITMSHSYSSNGATSEWSGVLLNNLANVEAQTRTAKAIDLYMGIWSGDQELAGHAGRDLTRTVRQLFDNLDLDPYDDESDEGTLDQFTTRVLTSPELAQAIRSTATLLHPGNIAHCLRYVTKMECATDGVEPIQGLCRPETCVNVLLEPEQQAVHRARHDQVTEWLGIPRIPKAQRDVLERRQQRLAAQLRTEADD